MRSRLSPISATLAALCFVTLPATAQSNYLVDFGVGENTTSPKSGDRLALVSGYLEENLTVRATTQVYDAATGMFTFRAEWSCKPKDTVLSDLAVRTTTLEYVAPAADQPMLVVAQLTPNQILGPCPATLRGFFQIQLPQRASFRFKIDIDGYPTVRGLTPVAAAFDGDACQGFDRFVNPRALMLPQSGERQARAIFDPPTAFSKVNFEVVNLTSNTNVTLLLPPPPAYKATSSPQQVRVKSNGVAMEDAKVWAKSDGQGLGFLMVDVKPKVDTTNLAVFVIRLPGRAAPANVPAAADLKTQLNNTYFGLQSNFFFQNVVREDLELNYDLDGDGRLAVSILGRTNEQTELDRLVFARKPELYGYLHLYVVERFNDDHYFALAFRNYTTGRIYFANVGSDIAGLPLTLNLAAHEIGHLLGLPDAGHLLTDLMYGYRDATHPAGPHPCDIRQADWNGIHSYWIKPGLPPSRPFWSVDALRVNLREGNFAEQSAAVAGLGQLRTREAIDVLMELLDSTGWRVEALPVVEGNAPVDAVLNAPLAELATNELMAIAPAPGWGRQGPPAGYWRAWWLRNRASWRQ